MPNPPAWSVLRGERTVFLFGVRPGARDSAWVTDRVRAAVSACDEFWRETPPEDEITSSPLLAELALSPDISLSERLDETTLRRLEAVTEALSIDRQALEPFRPWVAAQFVQEGALERAGVPPDQNMDVVLKQLAEEHGATIRYEFDVDGILRMFADLPESMEMDYLQLILDAAEGGPDLITEGFSAWLRGDHSLDELGDADWRQRYPRLYEPLIRERNQAWVPRIDDMLNRPGTRFVAVGCGHLAGEDSVLALLEQIDCQIVPQ